MSVHGGSYRDVLKASSVRGMLERKARLTDGAQPPSRDEPEATVPVSPTALHDLECDAGDHRWKHDRDRLRKREQWVHLHRWADDGGSGRGGQR